MKLLKAEVNRVKRLMMTMMMIVVYTVFVWEYIYFLLSYLYSIVDCRLLCVSLQCTFFALSTVFKLSTPIPQYHKQQNNISSKRQREKAIVSNRVSDTEWVEDIVIFPSCYTILSTTRRHPIPPSFTSLKYWVRQMEAKNWKKK